MFFVAFFWAYFDSGMFPKEAIGFTWPPKGIATVAPFGHAIPDDANPAAVLAPPLPGRIMN